MTCPKCRKLKAAIYKLQAQNMTIHKDYTRALEEIREVYAGMDGFVPETCPEGYQQRLLKRMYDIAVEALKIDEEEP